MFLFNIAEPDWISVDCDQKLPTHILCYVQPQNHSKSDTNVRNMRDYSLCLPHDIIIHVDCQTFIWFHRKNTSKHICKGLEAMPVTLKATAHLKETFIAISLQSIYPLLSSRK